MSWIRNGTNEVVFSGKDGGAQYVDLWTKAGKPPELPPVPGKQDRTFIYAGFLITYEPMI